MDCRACTSKSDQLPLLAFWAQHNLSQAAATGKAQSGAWAAYHHVWIAELFVCVFCVQFVWFLSAVDDAGRVRAFGCHLAVMQ